jgi:hypothetical protein
MGETGERLRLMIHKLTCLPVVYYHKVNGDIGVIRCFLSGWTASARNLSEIGY